MSTRAHIEFIDEHGATLHLDRSHDGYPNVILPDIERTVKKCTGLWSGSEIGQLVSHFIGDNYIKGQRIQYYEPCHGTAGDEPYKYHVRYNKEKRGYEYGLY